MLPNGNIELSDLPLEGPSFEASGFFHNIDT